MFDSFNQYSETATLQKVIIGRYQGYRKVEQYVEKVNSTQQRGLPEIQQLEQEYEAFAKVLTDHGIEVLRPNHVGKFVYDQLTPRDLGVTIGDKFVICNMANHSRRYEAAGIFEHILSMEGPEPTILLPPEPNMLIEGGDVIVDKGHIFVGLSNRTNSAAVHFLRDEFGDSFQVVPVPCESSSENDNPVLHLDCAFNPVGERHALIYSDGLKTIPPEIKDTYTLIEVSDQAQKALATNILSLNTETIVSRNHPDCRKVNESLEEAGLEVLTLSFDGAPATGGSFRCCTLPLVRG